MAINQERLDELIEQWDNAYQAIAIEADDMPVREDMERAASNLVWALIQLKEAGYELSEKEGWHHRTEENLSRDRKTH